MEDDADIPGTLNVGHTVPTFAETLRGAGVPVTLSRHAGHVHTSPVMTAVLEAARTWRAEVLDVLTQVGAGEPRHLLTDVAT